MLFWSDFCALTISLGSMLLVVQPSDILLVDTVSLWSVKEPSCLNLLMDAAIVGKSIFYFIVLHLMSFKINNNNLYFSSYQVHIWSQNSSLTVLQPILSKWYLILQWSRCKKEGCCQIILWMSYYKTNSLKIYFKLPTSKAKTQASQRASYNFFQKVFMSWMHN